MSVLRLFYYFALLLLVIDFWLFQVFWQRSSSRCFLDGAGGALLFGNKDVAGAAGVIRGPLFFIQEREKEAGARFKVCQVHPRALTPKPSQGFCFQSMFWLLHFFATGNAQVGNLQQKITKNVTASEWRKKNNTAKKIKAEKGKQKYTKLKQRPRKRSHMGVPTVSVPRRLTFTLCRRFFLYIFYILWEFLKSIQNNIKKLMYWSLFIVFRKRCQTRILGQRQLLVCPDCKLQQIFIYILFFIFLIEWKIFNNLISLKLNSYTQSLWLHTH